MSTTNKIIKCDWPGCWSALSLGQNAWPEEFKWTAHPHGKDFHLCSEHSNNWMDLEPALAAAADAARKMAKEWQK